jgi:ElaB/YqjD/DUF883 family membrane-anchored ribosome-binding protein
MSTRPVAKTNNLIDQAAASTDQLIKSTQRAAFEAFDGLSDGVQHLHDSTAPLLDQATQRASNLAQRSLDALRLGSQQLRDKARHTSDSTTTYIRQEPVKSMLIAVAGGAAVMAVLALLTRSRERH